MPQQLRLHKPQPPPNRPQQPRPLLWPRPLMLWLNKHPLLFPMPLLKQYLHNLGHKRLHNNLDNLGQWRQVKSDQGHQVKSDHKGQEHSQDR